MYLVVLTFRRLDRLWHATGITSMMGRIGAGPFIVAWRKA
jgi:hypothetical protein